MLWRVQRTPPTAPPIRARAVTEAIATPRLRPAGARPVLCVFCAAVPEVHRAAPQDPQKEACGRNGSPQLVQWVPMP